MTPIHHTRNTVSAEWYCPKCGKNTQHRIDDRRKGPCLVCLGKRNEQHDELQLKSEAYEERAAIKQFCGNLSREQAEREAHEEVFGKLPPKQERMF